jgi:vacuolar-type H+-ATPase subunit E/Vma4
METGKNGRFDYANLERQAKEKFKEFEREAIEKLKEGEEKAGKKINEVIANNPKSAKPSGFMLKVVAKITHFIQLFS